MTGHGKLTGQMQFCGALLFLWHRTYLDRLLTDYGDQAYDSAIAPGKMNWMCHVSYFFRNFNIYEEVVLEIGNKFQLG